MLTFAMAGKGELLKLALEKTDINVSAYATRDRDGMLWITVLNKDFTRDVNVEIALPENYSKAAAYRLNAPSMESKDHVTLASVEVSADGMWTSPTPESLATANQAVYLSLPHASAVLVRLVRH
jgi:hypothetical protein